MTDSASTAWSYLLSSVDGSTEAASSQAKLLLLINKLASSNRITDEEKAKFKTAVLALDGSKSAESWEAVKGSMQGLLQELKDIVLTPPWVEQSFQQQNLFQSPQQSLFLNQQASLFPSTQQSSLFPSAQQTSLFPSPQQSTSFPTQQQSSLFPSQQTSLFPSPQQSSLFPPAQTVACTPSTLFPSTQPNTFQQQPVQQSPGIGFRSANPFPVATQPPPATEDTPSPSSATETYKCPYLNTSAESSIPTFKVVLVGDGGVGKSTYFERLSEGTFRKVYIPTLGVEVRPITFNTSNGPIRFNCWDCAGLEKFGGLRDGYFIGGHAAMLFFDLTSRLTLQTTSRWHHDIVRVCEAIPAVMVATKTDIPTYRKITEDDIIEDAEKKNLPYTEISSKTHTNLEEPFLILARALTHNPSLTFVSQP